MAEIISIPAPWCILKNETNFFSRYKLDMEKCFQLRKQLKKR